MNILGIIPARSGSKGIPHKNLYPLNGEPLIDYTIEAAEYSFLQNFVISTDSEIYARKYKYYDVCLRPSELSQDETPVLPVVQHTIAWQLKYFGHKPDAIMILQPTSPLRTSQDIDDAILRFEISKASSLYSGYYMGLKVKNRVYDKHTQAPHFQRNGAIFIAKTSLIEQGKIWDDDVIEFEMPKSRSIDIDDMDDMFIAESLIKNRKEW